MAFLPAALRLLPLGRLVPRDQLAAALFPAGWVSAPSGHSPGLALLLPPLLFLVPCLSYGLPGSNLTLAGPGSEKLTMFALDSSHLFMWLIRSLVQVFHSL